MPRTDSRKPELESNIFGNVRIRRWLLHPAFVVLSCVVLSCVVLTNGLFAQDAAMSERTEREEYDWNEETPQQTWVRGEYLLWWLRGQSLPPLVTSSPAGTRRDATGVLGQPDTRILFGNERGDPSPFSGAQVSFGQWLDLDQTVGIEGSFFLLENEPFGFAASQLNTPLLARPYFDAAPGINSAASELVAYPGSFDGTVTVFGQNSFFGADFFLRHRLWDIDCDSQGDCAWWIDILGGYRYLRLREVLAIQEDIGAVDPFDPFVMEGTRFQVHDRFRTTTNFHGVQVGLASGTRRGAWTLETHAKLNIGANLQACDISGVTRVTVPGEPSAVAPGGLLAQATNSGRHRDTSFALVPELAVRLKYQWTERVRFVGGYSLIYWSDVLRPGEQIDLTVNSSQIGGLPVIGPARPAFALRESDFWAQGLNLGFEISF